MSDPNFAFPPTPVASTPAPPVTMSTGETLSGIFFEPARVFEALRDRPRFLVAVILSALLFTAFQVAFFQHVGYERVAREAIEASPRTANFTPEQKEQTIAFQTGPIFRVIGYTFPTVLILIITFCGGGLYLLGSMAMGKGVRYMQAVSVWAYSGLPPLAIAMVLNIILVFLKNPDDYDIVSASRRGLARANLGLLVDGKAAPVLFTLLESIDLFGFYGLFLAALGLRKVGKLSSGSAWGIVLAIWIFGVLMRLALAGLFGQAM
jgi:hypothetical protein